MRGTTISLGILLVVAASVADAQRRDERRDRGRPSDGRGFPSGFHLLEALDADRDGKVSAKEIDNATAVLRALDKDRDGKLSKEEIGWPPSGGFGAGGPGRGGFGRGGFGRGGPGGGGGPRGFPGFGGSQKPRRPDPDNDRARQLGGNERERRPDRERRDRPARPEAN